ncbi:aldehyde dehydrogenase (NADP(+)) [Pseudobacter ginsenosidimutans]|uniref:NADP-dependent aldehyde dehydrogenase n=1 Tax=Pseudobacter ginsenosidimutans TaxID=661488 RepID=A0A4Q7MCC4_9BACT|nr:aldehyde dehydrogenase (NADP(+)) [Pseudobacter ginsenosidimutans]QEC45202.1 aldehyde dehydrogenase (NADP(+)) [Pseudobacter ginsenosidimutans]RZS65471.1 NADP-dependent aldehyde dehydrogenase [Pseudobacter ginsenosidimutans]
MIAGQQIIGFDYSAEGSETFYSYNPAEQHNTNYLFHKATTGEINLAVQKAAAAFQVYRKNSGAEKAHFLNVLAEDLLYTGDELIKVCNEETGLPPVRIEGERMRTVNQIKMFATLLSEGSWVDARIDTGNPERTPLPKPDLRFMHIPIGPVVVFGASNFPLAFSVAGGDTISAFAAGCSVVVKAHPAHPATSAIIGKLVQTAAKKTNMPDGLFSLLFDDGIDVGIQLVKHPLVKAVGFTGSYKAGKALFDIAVSRPEPIPVYAEMGSTNPVFILPDAAKERGQEIAAAYAASVTMGIGQFCTNPGLMIFQNQDNNFLQLLKTAFEKTTGGVMLTPNILDSYNSGVHQHLTTEGVEQLAISGTSAVDVANLAVPVLLKTSGKVLDNNPALSEEIFGPTGMVVSASSKKEMLAIAENLSGHLTATVHGTEDELIGYRQLLEVLEQKAGRVVINGFPTGVEVGNAMVHGGPFPSTTDSRTTSVGTAAIYRFTRPVCYQNMPQQLLPPALRDKNVLNIYRLINGDWSTKDIARMT